MTTAFHDRLSELLREVELDLGATQMTVLVLKSIEGAMRDLKGQNLHRFFLQLVELTEDLSTTKPRFAMIIDAFHDVLEVAMDEELHNPKGDIPLKKKKFLKKLAQLIAQRKEELSDLLENAIKINVEGKEILVHDHSRTVMRILTAFKKQGKHFRVIVAEQDPDKTSPLIEDLHNAHIPFRVVPAYVVTHLLGQIDMMFLGGLTLKSTMDFVMDPGTNALVSQFHLLKRPIYIFMSTSKFSLWKAERRTEVYTHVHRRKHHCKSFDFERIKFSHDRVSAKLITKTVTEKGVFTPRELTLFFNKKMEERTNVEKEFSGMLAKLKKA